MLKEILLTILLGIIQGFTEFLPISSSGHLILLQEVFGIKQNVLFTTIILHFGTLVAVVVFYFKDLINIVKNREYKTIWLLFLATLPACIVGLFFEDIFQGANTSKFLTFSFLFTAIILLLGQKLSKKNKLTEIRTKNALSMGLFQCIALFPGVSRSGLTIFGGVMSGTVCEKSTKFSFLMSIPIIFGSLILELFKVDLATISITPLIFGFISAFICGLIAIKFMVKFVCKGNFAIFSIYLTILASICFVHNYVFNLW